MFPPSGPLGAAESCAPCEARDANGSAKEDRGTRRASGSGSAAVPTSSCGPRIRFVCISDTHGKHRMLHLPAGDVLIHAGDFTDTGTTDQVQDFHDWLRSLDFKHKLVIAGNHDVTFDGPYYERTGRARFHEYHRTRYDAAKTRGILADSPDVTYLEDAGCSFQMHGCRVNVYGSPWQPEFCEWAFNYPYDGPEAKRLWRAIPSATDVLITHGPPYGKGDCTVFYKSVGCEVLLHEVTTRVRPLVCVSGHIHEGYGVRRDEHTMYVNASTLDEDYRCVNAAIVFDLPVHAGGGDDPSGGAEPGGPTTTARLGRPVVVASQVRSWSQSEVAEWVADVYRSQREELCEKRRKSSDGQPVRPSHVWSEELAAFLSTLSGSALLALSRDFIFGELKAPCLTSIRDRVELMLAIRKVEAEFVQ